MMMMGLPADLCSSRQKIFEKIFLPAKTISLTSTSTMQDLVSRQKSDRRPFFPPKIILVIFLSIVGVGQPAP
jgi:hypothetical protein